MKVATTMRSNFRSLPFMLLLLYGAVGGCGLITDESRIKIAQIGDEAITRADLYTYIQQLPIEQRYMAKSKDAKLQILQKMVETKLLLQEADRRNVQVTNDEIENEMKRRGVQDISPGVLEDYGPVEGEGHDHGQERQSQHEQIAMELRLAKMQRQAIPPGLTVSDEEVEQFYEANKERFVIPESVRIRFVTCPTIEEAQKILDRTRAGEDFAGIVRETSVATQGKAAQEWPPSLYAPLEGIGPQELRDALREAESGDMIGPVERVDGFDVVQLIDRRARGAAPLDAVRQGVRQSLLFHKAGQAYSRFLADLRESYQANIFPENLPEDMPF